MKIFWREHRTGLDTNGCPLGNSKFILLSDNPYICLWLSACQVEKSNQLNDSWSNIYQPLSQPEARFRKYKHLTCSAFFLANSIRFILVLKRIKSDWRATLDLPWLTLLFMVSIRGVLMADYIWCHASSHNVVRGWPAAQKATLSEWCTSGRS